MEQNTRRTLRHAHWGYILVLGRNRLDGPARAAFLALCDFVEKRTG